MMVLGNSSSSYAHHSTNILHHLQPLLYLLSSFPCYYSVYREELYDPLIRALDVVSHEQTVIFLGLTRIFAKPLFFERLRAGGFDYTLVPHECAPKQYRSETNNRDIGLFIVRKSSV
jgi:hypothetical protein